MKHIRLLPTILTLLAITTFGANSQNVTTAPLQLLKVDSVTVQSNSRSERRAARERVRVRALTKELIERHVFEFDAFQYRFNTEARRVDVRFRFYGSTFYSSEGPKRDFAQSTKAPLLYGASRSSPSKFGASDLFSDLNLRFAALENFREEGQKLRFEVVARNPGLSAHGFYRYITKFEFVLDIFDGRMAMRVVYYTKLEDIEPVEIGPVFYGYIKTVR